MNALDPSGYHRRIYGPFALGLAVLILLSGCAAQTKSGRLKMALMKDEQFTVQKAPAGSPAQRVASFRIADQGRRAIQQGRLADADDLFEKALSLDRRNPFCYYYLAELRSKEDNFKQALILLNQAQVLFQGHPFWLGEVHAKKGLCWEKLHSPEKARNAYTRALKYNPWNETARKAMK